MRGGADGHSVLAAADLSRAALRCCLGLLPLGLRLLRTKYVSTFALKSPTYPTRSPSWIPLAHVARCIAEDAVSLDLDYTVIGFTSFMAALGLALFIMSRWRTKSPGASHELLLVLPFSAVVLYTDFTFLFLLFGERFALQVGGTDGFVCEQAPIRRCFTSSSRASAPAW